ncbi:hypothetical protein SCHPADRAFT_942937 [Schizopora paradoxa]|uniref:Uncharacterized protein n=1 Tax=Schizopora paradoxa TaxID=27342 RepID=A0A0H2RFI4_9AGAM|nr:hypothetical protein SCHPADRAFT_942937 [Schizopora paradoxa]
MPKYQKRQRRDEADDYAFASPPTKHARTSMSSSVQRVSRRGDGATETSIWEQTYLHESSSSSSRQNSKWGAKITKGQAVDKFHLEPGDFDNLNFTPKAVKGQTYSAHLYETKDVERVAAERGRIAAHAQAPASTQVVTVISNINVNVVAPWS